MKQVATLKYAWKAAAFAFLLMFSSIAFAQRDVPAVLVGEDEIMNNLEVQNAAYDLFNRSNVFSSTVRAMWVTYENGRFGFVAWPTTYQYLKETWKGPLPEHTVAIVHTVPLKSSERPSTDDFDLANGKQMSSVKLPVYVLHYYGISKVASGSSKPLQIHGPGWLDEFGPQNGRKMTELAQMKTK